MGSSCSNSKQPVQPPKIVRPKRATVGQSFEDRELEENEEYGGDTDVRENREIPVKSRNRQEAEAEDEDEEDGQDERGNEVEEAEQGELEEGEEEEEEGEDEYEEGEDEGDYDDDGEEYDDEYDEDGEEDNETRTPQESVSDRNIETIYGEREDHNYVLRNPFIKKKRNRRLVKELYEVPLLPEEHLYRSPYLPKKPLERPQPQVDEDMPDAATERQNRIKSDLEDYNIEKTKMILKFSITYEICNSADEFKHLFLFDKGLNAKDVHLVNLIYPRNPFGCPKVYHKGSFDLPGYDTRYFIISEPLSLSMGDFIGYHWENHMAFTEDEILYAFNCIVTTLLNIYAEIDLHYITDYDVYLDKEGAKFLVAPLTVNTRFEDIIENYTYDEIMNGEVKLDPPTNALVEVLPPEILKAWQHGTRTDRAGTRETSIVYCLGVILFKLATQKPRISIKDKENLGRLTVDLKFNYKVIPMLLKSTMGLNPATRKPLKFLYETLKSHKYNIPPSTTYKIKLNKLKANRWEVPYINFRSEGEAKLDSLMNDIYIGKGYVIALHNVDQACSHYDIAYETLVSAPDIGKNLQTKYIEVLFHLSVAMRELERLDDAFEYINEARLLCEYIYPKDHIVTARVLCEMATVHKEKDEEQQAIGLFLKAIEIFESYEEEGTKYTLATMGLLADARIEAKEFLAARQEILQMIKSEKFSQKQIGELHFYLSKVLEGEHLFEDAIDSLEKALYFYEESFATKEDMFKKILKALIRISMTIKRDEKVEMLKKHYKNKVPLFLKEIKIDVMGILEQQGAAYKVQENYKEAVEIYQRVAKLKLDVYGKKHPNYVNCREIIANLLEYDGKFEKALSQYKDIQRFKAILYGEGSLRIINTLISMGKCYEQLNKLHDALMVYKETASIQADKLGQTHKEYLRTLDKVNAIRKKLGIAQSKP